MSRQRKVHLVDPELVAMLDTFPALTLTPETLPLIRTLTKEMTAQAPADLPDFSTISVNEHYVPGPEGSPDVRVLVYLPTTIAAPLPALLWIHGGGYVIGSADQEDLAVKQIVSAVGCAAVSVDYRLAPETPHPGPVEDCYAALKWLYTHAGELALLTRDRGEVPLVFQLLIYPMLDDRTVTMAEPHPHTGEFIWTSEANRFGWAALLGEEPGGPGVSPYAAAARAEHLACLPPTFIYVGALDLFLEEDLEYARRLFPGASQGKRVR